MRAYVGNLPYSPRRRRRRTFRVATPGQENAVRARDERLGRLLSEMSPDQRAAFQDLYGPDETERFWVADHGGLQ